MNTRILQLCLSPNLGGLELYMQRLSLFLHSHAQTHLCIAEHSKLDAAFCEFPAIPKLQLRKHAWKNIFKNAKRLANYIDTNKIDVVHMHWTKDLPLCVFAKHLSQRKPKLIQSRHMNMTRFKSDFYHRHLYKNIDLMIAVTEQVKQQITRFVPDEICPPVKVSYIGAPKYKQLSKDAIQALRQQYNLDNNFVIALAGRIEPAKGQALLVEALEILDKPNVKIMLIGDAMEEEYLQQFKSSIDIKGLTSQAVFTGFVNNVQDLMAISDCVVLATDKETFGMVLIEAMHTGTAVLASNSGGPLEIITPNEDGLLFNSGDAADLAAQLACYIENEAIRQQLAHEGKAKALSKFESNQQFSELLTHVKQCTK
ncbi:MULTISPECIES: glycosyltransferase [unclassified Neptuniibacter]|uniref:glycosyltransferase n=1 Tax=unclassified Neptuniibacter TaxID=2630693 RepID=UPI0025DE4759|nr:MULTISPECIES: glycosyltransferase [unclassified Neptuniibacter]